MTCLGSDNSRERRSELNLIQNIISLEQGSQSHLGVRATLRDITQSAGRIFLETTKCSKYYTRQNYMYNIVTVTL